jgi:hypothetical protein
MKYKDFKGGCYIRISVKCRPDTLVPPYLIPWSEIEREGDELVCTQSQLAKYVSSIPDDIKPEKIFQEFKNGS